MPTPHRPLTPSEKAALNDRLDEVLYENHDGINLLVRQIVGNPDYCVVVGTNYDGTGKASVVRRDAALRVLRECGFEDRDVGQLNAPAARGCFVLVCLVEREAGGVAVSIETLVHVAGTVPTIVRHTEMQS